MFEEGVKLERCFLELGETEETEIEKKVGMKTNDLIKEVDQIITFLKALTDDVGLRVNKLLAQVDNMVAPLTNTVIKLEEVAEHLTLFRESTQRSLEALKLLEESSKQTLEGLQSFKAPDIGEATKQVVAIRTESEKALGAVRTINESLQAAKTPSLQPAEASEVSRRIVESLNLGEVNAQMITLKETGLQALEAVRGLEKASRTALQTLQGTKVSAARETAPEQPAVPAATPPSLSADRRAIPTSGGPPPSMTPSLSQAPSRPPPMYGAPRAVSSSVDEIFGPIEEAMNMNAGTAAKAILDVRDRIMGMTRKFGAIYDLAQVARDLNRYPGRSLDRNEKQSLIEKVMGWKVKLSEAMGSG